MKKHNETGGISLAVAVAVFMTILFIAFALLFAFTYMSRQDYKNNSDQKAAAAAALAVKRTEATKDLAFAEASKSPTKIYTGPETYGTVSFSYPKTYSGYVDTQGTSTPVNGYFHPDIVPGASPTTAYALRLQVIPGAYSDNIKQYETYIKGGKIKASAFHAVKVPSILGIRLDGEVSTGKQGSLILLPLRDKTLKIWTESPEFRADFDRYVVPSLSFVP